MKALTLKHPWAFAVARRRKDVENRVWRPHPGQLRPGEWFALHGGVVPKGDSLEEAEDDLDSLRRRGLTPGGLTLADATLPGLFAAARFAGCVTASPSPWFNGPHGWAWSELVVLPEPVPCRGAQGLWDIPAEALALFVARVSAADAEGGAP